MPVKPRIFAFASRGLGPISELFPVFFPVNFAREQKLVGLRPVTDKPNPHLGPEVEVAVLEIETSMRAMRKFPARESLCRRRRKCMRETSGQCGDFRAGVRSPRFDEKGLVQVLNCLNCALEETRHVRACCGATCSDVLHNVDQR